MRIKNKINNNMNEYMITDFHTITLVLIIDGKERLCDIGSFAYIRKDQKNQIIENSLCKKLENLLHLFFKKYIGYNPRTLKNLIYHVKVTLDDLKRIDEDFTWIISKENNIYINYTNNLINKIREEFKTKTNIHYGYYATKQKILAEFLSILRNTEIESIRQSYTKIRDRSSTRKKNIPAELENLRSFFQTNILIFEKFSEFIINHNKFPLNINENNVKISIIGIPDLNSKYKKLVFKENNLLPLKTIENNINEIKKGNNSDFIKNPILDYHYCKAYLTTCLKNLEESNLYFSKQRKRIINIAINSFLMALICITGTNLTNIFRLEMNSFQTVPSTKGMRALNIKKRSNKKINIEFGAKFLPYYKKFINFIKIIKSKSSTNQNNNFSNILFFNIRTTNSYNYFDPILLNDKAIEVYSRWFITNIKDIEWISPSRLRQSTAEVFLNLTDDPTLVSLKLSNTPSTVAHSYSSSSPLEVSRQLNSFFDELYFSSVYRARQCTDSIPVNTDTLNSLQTPSGHCTDPTPNLRKEFTKDSIQPMCSKPETCFFCENYAIHTDPIDLKKIISIQKIYKSLNINNEVHNQIIFRIDEILLLLSEKFPNIKNEINKTNKEVSDGYLDSFWKSYYYFLSEIGLI